jgi:NAD(P)-dependent dehydrogenase (short-subunit alcohol dehydrogenase family)
MGRLQDRIALISGASGGIGKATTLLFAKEGAKIGVHYHRDEESAGSLVEKVRLVGSEAILAKGDLIRYEEAESVVQIMLERFGRVDILVNIAGGARDMLIHEMTNEAWETIMDLNVKTAYHCVRAVVPSMMQRKYGRIINISSLAKNGMPWFVYAQRGRTNYATANAALVGFTRSLAFELAEHNITVNCVVPGPILMPRTEKAFRALENNPEVKVSPLRLIPLRRYGTPEDVAYAIAFFALDEAGYITGEELYVSGGLH